MMQIVTLAKFHLKLPDTCHCMFPLPDKLSDKDLKDQQ